MLDCHGSISFYTNGGTYQSLNFWAYDYANPPRVNNYAVAYLNDFDISKTHTMVVDGVGYWRQPSDPPGPADVVLTDFVVN